MCVWLPGAYIVFQPVLKALKHKRHKRCCSLKIAILFVLKATRYKCSLPLIYNNSILWTKTAGTLCLFTGIDVFSVCLSLISRKFLPTLNFFVLNQKKKNYALETFTATNKTKPYFLSVYTVESQETGPLVSKNVHHQSACVSLQDSPTLSWHCNYYKVEVTWLFQA